MNETPHYLRDLHRVPLAAIERLGEPCEPCRGTGFAFAEGIGRAFSEYDRIDEEGWHMVLCKPCRGTGKQGGKLLHALPNAALVVLAAALAREIWTGDDPETTAQDREPGMIPLTILQRHANGRVCASVSTISLVAGDPVSFTPRHALTVAARDTANAHVRRLCAHALACRSLFTTLLAEASRRRLLSTQADLLVAWDHALARGDVRPDDDRRLLLAEAWAACTVEPKQRDAAESDATAWLWRVLLSHLNALPTATGEQIDAIGRELGMPRLPGEADADYRERLRARQRSITGRLSSSRPNLQNIPYSSRTGVRTYSEHVTVGEYREPEEVISREQFDRAVRGAQIFGGAAVTVDIDDEHDG